MNKTTFLIALTGGIGSGKSTALQIIKGLKINTLSCDEITASLYEKQSVLRKLKKLFPTAISGKIKLKADKSQISKLVFNDQKLYKNLTDFLTQLTFKICLKRAKKLKGLVVVEVPLLFEFNKASFFDKVLVITRPLEDRISSVITRSKLTKEQVLARVSKQFNYDAIPEGVDVIENDGDVKALTDKLTKYFTTQYLTKSLG